jgi:cardiolipin synthase
MECPQVLPEGAAGPATHEVEGNRLVLLPGGAERLEALIELVESARIRIDIYYYIFAMDACGARVMQALIEACQRGVAVTLMVDAFGSAFAPQSHFDALVRAGGRFAWFGHKRSTRYLIRNHQKIVLVDGARVLVGGFNCEQLYFGKDDDPASWCDLGLLVEGPLAAALQPWYDALAHWTIDTDQRFRHLRRMVRVWKPREAAAMWLVGGPVRRPPSSWVSKLVADLHHVGRLDLVAAYFSPNPGMLRRIESIAKAGAARLITPMYSDNRATVGASRHLYRRLLRAGVSIFEFRPQKLHMKLIVIDDVVYVGSANFDMRSLYINLELMLRIEDAGFAQEARALVDRIERRSEPIDAAAYETMSSPLHKLIWWFNYLLVGVLDYTVTRRLNFRRRRD